MRILKVLEFDPPGDGRGNKLMLCAKADGVKLPAVVAFKGAAETGIRSKKIELGLVATLIVLQKV